MKTKVAVLNPIARDGLASTILDGLTLLEKKGRVEFALSNEYTDPDILTDYAVLSEEAFREYAQTADVTLIINGKGFDERLAKKLKARKKFFIDGSEVGENRRYDFDIQHKILTQVKGGIMLGRYTGKGGINRAMLKLTDHYFKREKPYVEGVIPLPFGIESKYSRYYTQDSEKDIDFCCIFGQKRASPMRKYATDMLTDFCRKNNFVCKTGKTKDSDAFYKLLARSKAGISIGGGGFDTLRFWEVLGNNCLLMTEAIDIYQPDSSRLEYDRIWEFSNLYDFQYQLQKIASFLRNEYPAKGMADEYTTIMNEHSSEARVLEILKYADQ